MASNAISSSQPLIPVFNGEKYEFWSIKMKTLFKSQDLWDLVKNGYSEPDDDEARLKENKKKDSKALFFIQQAVHENIFSRIMEAQPDERPLQTPPSSPSTLASSSSSTSSGAESSSSLSSSPNDTPPRKTRSLSEIYATTQAMFVADPIIFEEAA